ncbi:maleylpyruvate isomerase family mycothiol-dependent enzyme [Streptomyces sp. NPDC050504]|uniref:maleylpyruvate isomerase family mycothiol-dependent enzyme n=1 Tax=Streptomyces sp. NPDC050504 TaxID=3365618 RepID=UPI00379506BC
MDYVTQFRSEVDAFETAVRTAAREAGSDGIALVPSCPRWSVADLVLHLGSVHRSVIQVIEGGLREWPQDPDSPLPGLPPGRPGWPDPRQAPNRGPLAEGLLDWFTDGAAALAELFAARDPAERVWSWSSEQSVGFWLRMQTIEAAVHRWDAQNALGAPEPVDRQLAADAVTHTFEVMAPARRAWRAAPPGAGERMRFKEADGFRIWVVQTDPDEVLLNRGSGCCHVELAGTTSDLMLFLWHRVPKEDLAVRGDAALLDRYFKLVPPV